MTLKKKGMEFPLREGHYKKRKSLSLIYLRDSQKQGCKLLLSLVWRTQSQALTRLAEGCNGHFALYMTPCGHP